MSINWDALRPEISAAQIRLGVEPPETITHRIPYHYPVAVRISYTRQTEEDALIPTYPTQVCIGILEMRNFDLDTMHNVINP